MRVLATITRPTRGRVLWNDEDIVSRPDPLRVVLGYLPQDFGIYLRVDFARRLVTVAGVEVKLTPIEYRLLGTVAPVRPSRYVKPWRPFEDAPVEYSAGRSLHPLPPSVRRRRPAPSGFSKPVPHSRLRERIRGWAGVRSSLWRS